MVFDRDRWLALQVSYQMAPKGSAKGKELLGDLVKEFVVPYCESEEFKEILNTDDLIYDGELTNELWRSAARYINSQCAANGGIQALEYDDLESDLVRHLFVLYASVKEKVINIDDQFSYFVLKNGKISWGIESNLMQSPKDRASLDLVKRSPRQWFLQEELDRNVDEDDLDRFLEKVAWRFGKEEGGYARYLQTILKHARI